MAKIAIAVDVFVHVQMCQRDAGVEQPFDLRCQLPLHFDERHPSLQAGDDERFHERRNRPSSSTRVGT